MNAKKATKILAEKRCPAYEKREKEERLQKEMKHRSAQNHLFHTIYLGWGPKFKSHNSQ